MYISKCMGENVRIASDSDAERYLGRKLAMTRFHETELLNRVSSGWASFFSYKAALCNRSVPLKDRVRLFDAVVTPCVLYASGTWAMTAAASQKLTTTRRRMLRWMVRIVKASAEPWEEYVVRATHLCEDMFAAHGSRSWVTMQRQQKWRLAGKAATQSYQRWTTKLLMWKPWF